MGRKEKRAARYIPAGGKTRMRIKKQKRIAGALRHKRHLKMIAEHSGQYPCGAYYIEVTVPGKEPKGYYRELSRGRRSAYYKKPSARRARHSPFPAKGGGYKKVYDYWWSVT